MMMAADVMKPSENHGHVSVMREEVVQELARNPQGIYVDMTTGAGGHSEALLEALPEAGVICFDRDATAVKAASRRLADYGSRVTVLRASFDEVPGCLAEMGVELVDGILADLGISSAQLDNPARGMSFRLEGPLDMRMDPTQAETALSLIRRLRQEDLADTLYQLGEERRSRRIASCIKQSLEAGELVSTLDLRRAVVRAVGPRRVGGIDPATRTFQALRIAVNQELEQLNALLDQSSSLLRSGARMVVISFHSLEDRMVKRAFLRRDIWRDRSQKPHTATAEEQTHNPRSRSAKLRAATRI